MNKLCYIDPHILRALNKSELRKKVLFHLYKISPNHTYLSELARAVKSDPSNVLGCLRGLGSRYKDNSSLVEMGLVEIIKNNGYTYYRLCEDAREIVEYSKNHYQGYWK